jgi:flagellar biosynthesis protein FlhG
MLKKFAAGITGDMKTANNQKSCDVIAVTSGKGGVGKTTISANLAINLQQMNKKVLLVDADIHLGNTDLILGTRTDKTLADLMKNDVFLSDIIVQGPGNIDVLPASSAALDLINAEEVFLRRLASAFKMFNHKYDFMILDTGAGIGQNVISFLLGASKILVIITPDPASITDAYAIIKVIRSVNMDVPVFLSTNMVNSNDEGEILYKKMNLMVQKFLGSRISFGGSILKDDMIGRSVRTQRPFVLEYPNSGSANAIRVLNRRLLQAVKNNTNGGANIFEKLIDNRKIQFEWNL